MPSPSPSPSPLSSPIPTPPPTSLLILGAGWTSTFLLPHLTSLSIPHACTSTTGRSGTIPFIFRPSSTSPPASTPPPLSTSSPPPASPSSTAPPPASTSPPPSTHPATPLSAYRALPRALTILITFPLKGSHAPTQLVRNYRAIHGPANTWILLGSTGIFPSPPSPSPSPPITSSSPYDQNNPRAMAEDAFLNLLGTEGTVLCLAGLWGGNRHPRGWIAKVAGGKEALRGKGSLHLVHGRGVARAVVGAYRALGGGRGEDVERWEKGEGDEEGEGKEGREGRGLGGKRWIVTDGRVYDWWEVVMGFGDERERGWVRECMREAGVEGLPRGGEALGRRLDGRAFWGVVGEEAGEGLFGGGEGG